MTKKQCNHEGKMYPVEDIGGWNVGYLCDCGYFVYRQDILKYEERRRIDIKDELHKNKEDATNE